MLGGAGAGGNGAAGGSARGPGPLEIIAAEPAGHVHRFADNIKAGLAVGLHRFGADTLGVDPAERYFGGAIAFGAAGGEVPMSELVANLAEGGVALIGQITV